MISLIFPKSQNSVFPKQRLAEGCLLIRKGVGSKAQSQTTCYEGSSKTFFFDSPPSSLDRAHPSPRTCLKSSPVGYRKRFTPQSLTAVSADSDRQR